jgi:hypothetical protein
MIEQVDRVILQKSKGTSSRTHKRHKGFIKPRKNDYILVVEEACQDAARHVGLLDRLAGGMPAT